MISLVQTYKPALHSLRSQPASKQEITHPMIQGGDVLGRPERERIALTQPFPERRGLRIFGQYFLRVDFALSGRPLQFF